MALVPVHAPDPTGRTHPAAMFASGRLTGSEACMPDTIFPRLLGAAGLARTARASSTLLARIATDGSDPCRWNVGACQKADNAK
jgi:hypothetical protein